MGVWLGVFYWERGNMNAFIEEKCVRLAVNERVFGFEGVNEAYKYLMGQEHFSKVCIRLGQ